METRRGLVRRALALERSPLGGRECVYWDVREGLEDEPRTRGAVDFWLEDAGGRVLVRGEGMRVEARAERREEVLGRVDDDIHEVSRRVRAVKDALRAGNGDAKALHRERKELADLATLLCAVRAQARGRVHIGGSNEGQRRWIAEHARAITSGPGERTLRLVVEQWEVVLAPGDEIELEGELASEPAPPGLGQGGGYRESARIDVLRAPSGGSLVVRGVGAASVERTARPRREVEKKRTPPPGGAPPGWSDDQKALAAVATLTGVAVALAWLLTR